MYRVAIISDAIPAIRLYLPRRNAPCISDNDQSQLPSASNWATTAPRPEGYRAARWKLTGTRCSSCRFYDIHISPSPKRVVSGARPLSHATRQLRRVGGAPQRSTYTITQPTEERMASAELEKGQMAAFGRLWVVIEGVFMSGSLCHELGGVGGPLACRRR